MKLRFTYLSLFLVALLFAGSSFAQTISISSGSGDTVCHGTLVTFTATATGSGTYGYSWTVNGAPVSTSSVTYNTPTLVNGDVISCALTNVAGDTTYATSNIITMTVDSLPVITPILGLDSVCAGSTLQLYDSTHGGVWSSTNPLSATVDSTGLVTGIAPAVPGGPGPLRIVYKMTNGCGSDSVRFRIRVNIPAGPITGPAELCIDSVGLYRDTARGGIWSSSDVTIADFISNFGAVQAYMAGTTSIYYALANACGTYADTFALTVINCDTAVISGINVINSQNNGLNIFPNPNTGSFSMTLANSAYTTANCVITNMIGEKVQDLTINAGKQTDIKLNAPAGLYFVTVTSGNEKYTSKLVITQ